MVNSVLVYPGNRGSRRDGYGRRIEGKVLNRDGVTPRNLGLGGGGWSGGLLIPRATGKGYADTQDDQYNRPMNRLQIVTHTDRFDSPYFRELF